MVIVELVRSTLTFQPDHLRVKLSSERGIFPQDHSSCNEASTPSHAVDLASRAAMRCFAKPLEMVSIHV
jgi:hypothetical protein